MFELTESIGGVSLFLLLDLAVILILLLFVKNGISKGFVLSFLSFLAVFVALFGAQFLARQLSPIATEWITPRLTAVLETKLNLSSDILPSPESISEHLSSLKIPKSLSDSIAEKVIASAAQGTESLSTLIVSSLLQTIAFAILFLFAFAVILFLWNFLSRTVNLFTHLPILNFANKTLGGLLGGMEAILFLFILRWILCDLSGLISPDLLAQTFLLENLTVFLPLSFQ